MMILSAGGVFLMAQLSSIVTLDQALIYAGWSALTCAVIAYSRTTHHEYYYSLLMDGVMLMLWVMLAFL
jgi:hypothetical protein